MAEHGVAIDSEQVHRLTRGKQREKASYCWALRHEARGDVETEPARRVSILHIGTLRHRRSPAASGTSRRRQLTVPGPRDMDDLRRQSDDCEGSCEGSRYPEGERDCRRPAT